MIRVDRLADALREAYANCEFREPTAEQRRAMAARERSAREAHRRRLEAYWPEHCRRMLILGQMPDRADYFGEYE